MSDFVLRVRWDAQSAQRTPGYADAANSLSVAAYDDGMCRIDVIENQNRPLHTCVGGDDAVMVGTIRLDNRETLLARAECRRVRRDVSDLELAARYVASADVARVCQVLGDFAIVTWCHRTRTLAAARDAFGVRRLYFAHGEEWLAIASQASLLHRGDQFDMEFIAEYLAAGSGPADRTIYAGVQPVPPACMLIARGGTLTVTRYWQPSYRKCGGRHAGEMIDHFRDLLLSSVRQRLGPANGTWARLSGGLDSSSIVSLACYDAERQRRPKPIAGTITTVDTLGCGDERDFAAQVLRRYTLDNVQVMDYWLWRDDGSRPPMTDQPHLMYPFYARDRRGAFLLREGGASVVLCGLGADHYMQLPPVAITDDLARGHLIGALTTLWQWSVAQRVSFWRYLRVFAIRPFLPRSFKGRSQGMRAPVWLRRSFSHQYNLRGRIPENRYLMVSPGSQLDDLFQYQFNALPTGGLAREVSGEGLDMRYPFLSRPLVDYALTLPFDVLMRPTTPKWILREAMQDVLPEAIRTRTGKGTIGARLIWSVEREYARIAALTRNSILEDLGCIRGEALRAKLDQVRCGEKVRLWLETLSLETWLRVRTGRWPLESISTSNAA
jgi:asparagine synthase (glutamine-hydrolysing)